jgi:hypothetical protein
VTGPLVIITSKGYLPRMRAHRILLEHGYDNYWIVVDNEEQALRVKGAGVPPERIAITERPILELPQDGIAWTREWIEKNLVPLGTWYVTLDDNVGGWTWLPEPFYRHERVDFEHAPGYFRDVNGLTWRQLYDTPCPFEIVVERWVEMIAECEKRGTIAGGFSIENNFFFRGSKWQTLGYVRAQNAVWKNTGLPFYYWPGAMLEDFVRSVDVVARYGSVLINRFVKPQKKFFEAGGIGTFEERQPNLIACNEETMRRWPGLTRRVKDRDWSLTFALRGKKLDEWRRANGYLKEGQ